MIDYIKFLILAIFSGIFAPLPLSSSAQFSLMNSVLNFSQDEKLLGFYYSVFMIVFSVAVYIRLRKIHLNMLKSCFSKQADTKNDAYRKRMKNVLLSLIPTLILFCPVGKNTLLCDYADRFLTSDSLFIVGVASVFCGLYLVISIWYTAGMQVKTKRSTETKDIIRMSFYNLVPQMIPGLSKVSFSSTNLLVGDVDSRVIAREIYLYLGPQVFVFNTFKVIRALLSGVTIDPVLLIISIIVVFICSMLMISLVAKINIRRLLPFFSVYSVVFGVFAVIVTFII